MRGRVKVDPYLRAPGYEDIFIIGDCALIINEEINRPFPPTAQISMQQGELFNATGRIVSKQSGKTDQREFRSSVIQLR